MWGVVYQGYNAVYPSYYPELFATRYRVSAMAIAVDADRVEVAEGEQARAERPDDDRRAPADPVRQVAPTASASRRTSICGSR
jgi:hypothetical protein